MISNRNLLPFLLFIQLLFATAAVGRTTTPEVPPASILNNTMQSIQAQRNATRSADARIARLLKAVNTSNPAAVRKAALDVMSDPFAVRRINLYGDDTAKKAMNTALDGVKTHAKTLIKQRLSGEIAARYGKDAVIDFAEMSHARGGKVHVGQDWDVTVRVRRMVPDANGKLVREVVELPVEQVSRVVHESFYEAASGVPRPKDPQKAKGYAKIAKQYAHKHAVTPISGKDAEAFKEASKVLGGKRSWFGFGPKVPEHLQDVQQLGLAMRHKTVLPRNEGLQIMDDARRQIEKLGLSADDPKAQKILKKANQQAYSRFVEYARTYDKLYNKHVVPRVNAAGGKVPRQILQSQAVWKQLANGQIDWYTFKRKLADLGQSHDGLVTKTMGLPEAAQKLGQKNSVSKVFKNVAGKLVAAAPIVGAFGKAFADEMDQRVWQEKDFDAGGLADVAGRVLYDSIVVPGEMLGHLGKAAMDGTARKFDQGASWLYRKQKEVGFIRAFGEGSYLMAGRMVSASKELASHGLEKGTKLLVEGLKGAGNLMVGAVSNPLGTAYDAGAGTVDGFLWTADKFGQLLMVDQAFRLAIYDSSAQLAEVEQFKAFGNSLTGNLNNAISAAEKILPVLKKTVREGRPESAVFQQKIVGLVQEYGNAYQKAGSLYGKWITVTGKWFSQPNPVLDRYDLKVAELRQRLDALPTNPLSFLMDPEFLEGLLSELVFRFKDGETGKPVAGGGWVQLNGAGFERVCRGEGPVIRCAGIPPGIFQLGIKVGDYAKVTRQISVKPLERRLYRQTVTLKGEAPLWAWITVNVRDVESKAPIPGAKVRFRSEAEAERSSVTSTGALRINQVLAGKISVTASAHGYLSNTSRMAIDPAQVVEYDLDLYLQPDSRLIEKPKEKIPELPQEPEPEPEKPVVREKAPEAPKKPRPPVKSAQNKAKACFSQHEKKLANARKANAAADPNTNMGLVLFYASKNCEASHKKCSDQAFDKGVACRKAGKPNSICNPLVGSGWKRCAQQEVECSAGVYRQQCGLK